MVLDCRHEMHPMAFLDPGASPAANHHFRSEYAAVLIAAAGCRQAGSSSDWSTEARLIGIGAAVTHRPLPHHRAYGSVHGGSIGYASNPRLTTEARGTGSRHSTA